MDYGKTESPSHPMGWKDVLLDLGISAGAYVLILGVMLPALVTAGGPGCNSLAFAFVVGLSAILMLRKSLASRVFCLLVLLAALYGMQREINIREAWLKRHYDRRIQNMVRQFNENADR